MADPTVMRDSAGNLREVFPSNIGLLLTKSANVSTATASAAAAAVTIGAADGYRWVVDSARVCIASIAANTMVLATLSDGSTVLNAECFSANGQYDLAVPNTNLDQKLKYFGTDNTTLNLHVSSAGTGSTTTVRVAAHKALADDV